jgi:1-acyl-sn-glycerol-3-phosphate acyltransferase
MNTCDPWGRVRLMLGALLKTCGVFFITMKYLVKSFLHPRQTIFLKQAWARDILAQMNFQLQVQGRPHIARKLILVGNHVSYLDIVVLMALFPEVVFLAKADIKNWPLIGWAARRIGTLFVHRESKDSRQKTKTKIIHSFKHAKGTLQLAVFPSGTTQLNEEKPWRHGVFEIAKETGTPIQPFCISYSPLRDCAYIDEDSLFSSMLRLYGAHKKSILFKWGTVLEASRPELDSEQVRLWTVREAAPPVC